MLIKKKVIIAGKVQTHNRHGIDEFSAILETLYPKHSKQIREAFKQGNNYEERAQSLIKLYRTKLKKVKPTLPVELYLDVPEAGLAKLFDRCNYSYLPAYRGATLRNTSISTSISQNLITYAGQTGITPEILKEGGDCHGAVTLMPKEKDVLRDIAKREKNTKLNKQTIKVQKRLVRDEISANAIAKKHIGVYSLVKVSKKLEEKSDSYLESSSDSSSESSEAESETPETKLKNPELIETLGNKLNSKIHKNKLNSQAFLNPPKYKGIGVKAKYPPEYEDGYWIFEVIEVAKNSPASKAGIKANTSMKFPSENGDDSRKALKELIMDIRNNGITKGHKHLKSAIIINKNDRFELDKTIYDAKGKYR